jgi:hypothetical protein
LVADSPLVDAGEQDRAGWTTRNVLLIAQANKLQAVDREIIQIGPIPLSPSRVSDQREADPSSNARPMRLIDEREVAAPPMPERR